MIDAERLLGNMMRSGLRGRKKKGRGIGSSALAAGAMPILAGVAFAAAEHFLQNRKAGQGAGGGAQRPGSMPPPPPPSSGPVTGPVTGTPNAPPPLPGAPGPDAAMGSPAGGPPPMPGAPAPAPIEPTPEPDAGGPDEALLLVRFMIAAAKADGVIDAAEREAILKHLEESAADGETYAFVSREMLSPLEIDTLVAEARDPRVAVEAYAVSLMAIDADTDAERQYLARLAGALGLDDATVKSIETQVDASA